MDYQFDRIIDRRRTNSIKWTQYEDDVLPLWVADMDFPAPEVILDSLKSAIEHGVLGYEIPGRLLQETVTARMDNLYRWKISPDDVVTIPGVVAGFNLAARAVCSPGSGLLIQPPVYFPFLEVHEHIGLVRQDARLTATTQVNRLDYSIDFDSFEATVDSLDTHTEMFLLCNPHNPVGMAIMEKDLMRLADICIREDIIICSDEIHCELLLDNSRHIPIASLSPEIAERTITLVSASKAFNIPGLFVGFAIIQNPGLREKFQHECKRRIMHPNSLGMIASQAAFSGKCDNWMQSLNAYLTANRDYLVEYVFKHFPGARTTVPQATYLAWLDFRDMMAKNQIDGTPADFFLKEARVALNDGASFGPGGEGFVRLNFGCPRATLEDALDRMKQALNR